MRTYKHWRDSSFEGAVQLAAIDTIGEGVSGFADALVSICNAPSAVWRRWQSKVDVCKNAERREELINTRDVMTRAARIKRLQMTRLVAEILNK